MSPPFSPHDLTYRDETMRQARIAALCLLLLPAMATAARPQPPPDFAALVERYGKAVVNISSQPRAAARLMPPPGRMAQEEEDAAPRGGEAERLLNDILRRAFQDRPGYEDENTLGSGVIISPDGYILTCAHVVEDAHTILVRMTDRREWPARLVGLDRKTDIALLKIEAEGLPTVRFGDPSKLKVGEWVLAIGAPFGFENSATSGIVSALGRCLPDERYVPFIQTDVAINPGSSGGPLFNLRGEVVGINSQIFSRTGGFMGLSFAIPIDLALRVAEQLKTAGYVSRGWLGVSLQEVSKALAEAYGLGEPRGALVADVLPGSPAARSALRPGDVVLAYQGEPIARAADLPLRVGETAPGTRVRMTVFRRSRGSEEIVVGVGELRESAPEIQPERARSRASTADELGLVLEALSPAARQARGLYAGVVVVALEDGPGLRAGLRPGDVILEVDGQRVDSPAAFQRLVAQTPRGSYLVLRVRRAAASVYLALRR